MPEPAAPEPSPSWPYCQVLEFPKDTPTEYVHGFACGQIWAQMKAGVSVIEETVAHDSREIVEVMAAACGWTAQITPVDDQWLEVRLTNPEPTRPPRPGDHVWAQRDGSEHVVVLLQQDGQWWAPGEAEPVRGAVRVLGPLEPPELGAVA